MKMKIFALLLLTACVADEKPKYRERLAEISCYGAVIDTARGIPYTSKNNIYHYTSVYGGLERVPVGACSFRVLP